MTNSGALIFLRVTPNASTNSVDGIEHRADDTLVLKLRVTAIPDKGKANKSVIELISKTLGLPKSAFSIQAGEISRTKTIRVETSLQDLEDLLISKFTQFE